MLIKLLMTTCLLVASLSAIAQSGKLERQYPSAIFNAEYKSHQPQQFNDRFSRKPKQQGSPLAEQDYISKAQAIEIARQRSDGKILSVKLIVREQHAYYKIKILSDQGRIKTLRINAARR